MLVYCANGQICWCFPVLSNIIADYKEQALIIGIKSSRYCPICQVHPDERQDLSKRWAVRTHKQMKDQVRKQQQGKVSRKDSQWVHETDNFAWNHHYVNIYESMSVDILHQLHKGVVQNLIDWIKELVGNVIPGIPKKKKTKQALKDSPGGIQLDARFRAVPHYTGLKHFGHFSHVQQWTGDEQKAVLRILIPVVTPLLLQKAPDTLAYARAIADFVTIVQYRSHDEETVRYLKHAINIINLTKGVFSKQRETKNKKKEPHWNYPKFHSISHYPDFIRRWGAPDGYNSDVMEAAHKYLLKSFYDRTNKGKRYQDQIAKHNTIATNIQAMDGVLAYYFGLKSIAREVIPTYLTTMARDPINLEELGWMSSKEN